MVKTISSNTLNSNPRIRNNMISKKKPLKTVKKVNHRRRLDNIFTRRDDAQLIRGILKYGKKWKHIWETYDLKHIDRMSLKDRARSKAFKILMERAKKDIRILDQQETINASYQNSKSKNENEFGIRTSLEKSGLYTRTESKAKITETVTMETESNIRSDAKLMGKENEEKETNISRLNPKIDQAMTSMNLNLDVEESDFPISGHELRQYTDFSPRLQLLQWGGSILEDLGTSSSHFGLGAMFVDTDGVEPSSYANFSNFTEV